MPKLAEEDGRLTHFSAICLSFPEATRKDNAGHASFQVRKKTFAYYLNNHHGDGIVASCFKVPPGDNVALIRSDPTRFYLPAYIGAKGWIGVRLDLGDVDWEELGELALHSYLRTAPKSLCKKAGLIHSASDAP